MKLPLRYGLLLLAGLLLLSATLAAGPERSVVLLAAMGVAVWTAFSLPGISREEAAPETGEPTDEEADDDEPPRQAADVIDLADRQARRREE